MLWKGGTFLEKMPKREKREDFGYFKILLESKAVTFLRQECVIILTMVVIFLMEIVLQI